ncbi:hypothetical protein [Tenacibaculum phage JQ]|nr:hypothetical protein [Tenacibaculum phage JQ]
MKELQEILKYTKDLVEQEPEKSAYWHYNKLVSKIEEVIDVIQCCKSDSELLNHEDLEIGEQVRITQTKLVEINCFREGGDIDVEDTTSVFTVSLNEISKVV